MADGYVNEVGARLNLVGRKAFLTGITQTKDAVKDFAASTVKSNEQIAASTKELAALQSDLAAKTQAASEAQAKAAASRRTWIAAQAAGDREAAVAAKELADADVSESLAANRVASSARLAVSAQKARIASLKSEAAASDMTTTSVDRHATALAGLAKMSRAVVLGSLGATTAAAYEGAKAFMSYQSAITAIYTQAGLTQNRVNSLSDSILKLAKSGKAPLNPTDLANMTFRIASSTSKLGLSNRQDMAMLRAATGIVTIGSTSGSPVDPEEAARVLGGIRASGIKGAGSAKHVAALATAAVGTGDLHMSDLVSFISTGVLSSARLTGVKLPQLFGLLSLLGDNLESGSMSGSSLAHGLQLLAAPSSVGQNAYKAIGLRGTEIAQDMRTKSFSYAMQDLYKHLSARGMINPNRVIGQGMSAMSESQWLQQYGFSAGQVTKAAKVGLGQMGSVGKSLMTDIIDRAFGGARQMRPLAIALTEGPRYTAAMKQIHGNSNSTVYNAKLAAAMKTDQNQFKALDSQIHAVGIELGSAVLPKVVSFGRFLERDATEVKAVAGALSTLLIPAMTLYTNYLSTRALSSMSNMLAVTSRTQTATSALGSTAEGTSPQFSRLGGAISGVTALIGTYSYGRATAGQGASGAFNATFTGALSGAAAGLSVFGPAGGVVGAAIGGLTGLWSHFHSLTGEVNQTSAAVKALTGNLKTALVADKGVAGTATKSSVLAWLQQNPAAAAAFHQSHIRIGNLMPFLRGNPLGAGITVTEALHPGASVNGATYSPAYKYLQEILTAFTAAKGQAANLHYVMSTPAHTKHRAFGGPVQPWSSYIVGEHGPEVFRPQVRGVVLPHAALERRSSMSDTGAAPDTTPMVVNCTVNQHFHGTVDHKLVYSATKRGLQEALARN